MRLSRYYVPTLKEDPVEAELVQPLTVVATGGLAPYIMPCCKRKIIYDADLLFKGLALIWERNGK